MTRGYIVLNIIRACSIIALVMAVVAAMATLVKSFILSKFFLFDVMNNIFLSIFCTLVFFSEIDFFPSYYEKRWPLFGPKSSLVSVGIAEIIIGFQLLGNLNERNASRENIGYSFNALLLAAGAIASAIGFVVFIASYIFSNSQTHTTARTVRSKAYNSSKRAEKKPIVVLEEVQVITESLKLDRPQRTYSQSSRRNPSGLGMERSSSPTSRTSSERGLGKSTSTASSHGPFPYTVPVERGVEKFYSGPPVTAVHERSYSMASKTPSSFYSQCSVGGYSVQGNPYS